MHQGAPKGCQGATRGSGGVRGTLRAGRKFRYLGASMGIGGIRGLLGVSGDWSMSGGCRGCQGCIGAGRECRY